MGLDSYLNKMPRYRGATANDVYEVESYLDWINATEEGRTSCTLKEWCGLEKEPHKSYVDFYEKFFKTRYSTWDTEKKYGYNRIIEQVGYWRKANQIHNWFVEKIQGGVDDCDYHREVTEEDLEELLDICERVLASCEFVDGKINNGYTFDENCNRVPILEDGKCIKDPSVAMELLPTGSGFFFGSTDYDEYYVDDIKETIDIITRVLETTDFDKEMVYYVSSW